MLSVRRWHCFVLALSLAMPIAHAKDDEKAKRCQFSLRTLLLLTLGAGAVGTTTTLIHRYNYVRSEEYMDEAQKRFDQTIVDNHYADFNINDFPLLEYDPAALETWIATESQEKKRLVPNLKIDHGKNIRALSETVGGPGQYILPYGGAEAFKTADKALKTFLSAGNYKKIQFYDATEFEGSGNLIVNDDPSSIVVLYDSKYDSKEAKAAEKQPRIVSRGPVVLLVNDDHKQPVVSSDFIYSSHLDLPHAAPRMIYTERDIDDNLTHANPRGSLQLRYKYGLHRDGLIAALKDPREALRYHAVTELGRDDGNLDLIVKHLADPSSEVRIAALDFLTRFETNAIDQGRKVKLEHIDQILRLTADNDISVQSVATKALESIALAQILKQQDHSDIRDKLFAKFLTDPKQANYAMTALALMCQHVVTHQRKEDGKLMDFLIKEASLDDPYRKDYARATLLAISRHAEETGLVLPKNLEARKLLEKK